MLTPLLAELPVVSSTTRPDRKVVFVPYRWCRRTFKVKTTTSSNYEELL